VRFLAITLLLACGCDKVAATDSSKDTRETGAARPTVGFESLTGTADFSSSGGVFVRAVETPDPDDAKRLQGVMDKDIKSLQPCLNDRRLAKLWPSEVEFHLDASGRASSFALPNGQTVPCLTDWLEGLTFESPKGGKSIKVKVVLLVALE
jgi:hypothetical protein